MTKKFVLIVLSIILAIAVICVSIVVPLKSCNNVTERDDTVYDDENETLPSTQQTFENAFKVANDNIMVALNKDLNSIKINDFYSRDSVTIDGKGHTIKEFSFSTACKNVVFKNIHVINNVSSSTIELNGIDTKFTLNSVDIQSNINFTQDNSQLNILGTVKLIGADSSSVIKAKGLTVTGEGALEMIAGTGRVGQSGGVGISVSEDLTVNMPSGTLKITGGMGGSGAFNGSEEQDRIGASGGAAVEAKSFTVKAVNNMILIGGKGGTGGIGTTGSTGSKGSDKNLVFATAQQGGTGGAGAKGGTGGKGAIPIVLGVDNKICIEEGNVTITSGAGGNGGQGGQGGQGGSGGNTDAWKATAGKGGTGGTGGTGGDGRYSTLAMSIDLFEIDEGVKLTLLDGVDGVPGTGGTGGPGGNGGIYTGNPSSWGSDGADGDWGQVGEKGGMV